MSEKSLSKERIDASNSLVFGVVYKEAKVKEAVKRLKSEFPNETAHDGTLIRWDGLHIQSIIDEIFGKELCDE